MEDVIDPAERLLDGNVVANVADMELHPVVRQADPHVLLLLLVAAEDPDLTERQVENPIEDGIAERPGATGDEEHFVVEHHEPQGWEIITGCSEGHDKASMAPIQEPRSGGR